jgi:D-aminoacyl-tRNA deacylase
MYKKYLVIASKKDLAGMNITEQLAQFQSNPMMSAMKDSAAFDIHLIDTEIIDNSGIDPEKIKQYDFIIFASKHQSEKKEKSLSVHAPGNWLSTRPELGGQAGKVCKSSGLFQKKMFEKLNKNTERYELLDYSVTLEVTHHGPLIDKPCVFIEVGSTETEWQDKRAGFVIAKTISDIVNGFEENPYREVAVGIGGPHYCPNFNKLQLSSNVAFSHIIPKYVLPFTEEMILEAIKKTEEEVDFVILDWKGIGDEEQRNSLIKILEKNYISYKRVNEIDH